MFSWIIHDNSNKVGEGRLISQLIWVSKKIVWKKNRFRKINEKIAKFDEYFMIHKNAENIKFEYGVLIVFGWLSSSILRHANSRTRSS